MIPHTSIIFWCWIYGIPRFVCVRVRVCVCARAHTCISISFYVYAHISIYALSLHYFFSPISDLVLPSSLSLPLSPLSLPSLPLSRSLSLPSSLPPFLPPSLPSSLLPFSSIYPFLYLSVKITITNYETFGMCNTHAPTHRHTTHSRARTHTLPSIS